MNGIASPLPDNVADVWLTAAIQYAETRGYSFAPNCLAELTTLMNNAAARLSVSTEDVTADSQLHNVQRLVQYMIKELNEDSPGARELDEETLAAAMIKLCPLFPLC